MTQQFIAKCNDAFRRRTVAVFLEGADRVLRELRLEAFVVCANKSDLSKATPRLTTDGWRYSELSDGSIAITSIAMVQVGESVGIEKALPWFQSMFEPNWTVTYQPPVKGVHGARLVLTRKEITSLLLKAGIESNPGPSWILGFCLLCTLGLMTTPVVHVNFVFETIKPAMTTLKTNIVTIVDWLVGPTLDQMSYSCMIEVKEWENRMWLHSIVRSVPLINRLVNTWFPYEMKPRTGIVCNVLAVLWPIPEPEPTQAILPHFYALIALCGVILGSVSVVVTVCLVRGRHIVVVRNQNTFADINALKDQFRRDCIELEDTYDGISKAGEHRSLAKQRRDLERWCFNTAFQWFDRVRDVGGSRSRFPHLGLKKHICSPVLSNADILREGKAVGHFENCGQRGEYCPKRYEIPAAILSHVDYYMTPEQLTRIVTGPTFIINHDFKETGNKKLAEYDDNHERKCECTYEINDGLVSMTPNGGTPYLNHPYNLWMSEGSVVSSYGAFTYVELGRFKDTRVIFAFPMAGKYESSDASNLQRSVAEGLPQSTYSGKVWEAGSNADSYTYRCADLIHSIPRNVIEEVALTMCSAPRDVKYFDTMRSYASGKFRANNVPLNLYTLFMPLISYMADKLALEKIHRITAISGSPLDYGFKHRIINGLVFKLTHWFPNARMAICDFVLRRPWLSKLTPWMFTTITVPTYEVFTKLMRAKITDARANRFFLGEIPSSPKTTSPVANNSTKCRTSKDTDKCDCKHGESCIKCRPKNQSNINTSQTRTEVFPRNARRSSIVSRRSIDESSDSETDEETNSQPTDADSKTCEVPKNDRSTTGTGHINDGKQEQTVLPGPSCDTRLSSQPESMAGPSHRVQFAVLVNEDERGMATGITCFKDVADGASWDFPKKMHGFQADALQFEVDTFGMHLAEEVQKWGTNDLLVLFSDFITLHLTPNSDIARQLSWDTRCGLRLISRDGMVQEKVDRTLRVGNLVFEILPKSPKTTAKSQGRRAPNGRFRGGKRGGRLFSKNRNVD
jgi:cell shape-determining protein MreD